MNGPWPHTSRQENVGIYAPPANGVWLGTLADPIAAAMVGPRDPFALGPWPLPGGNRNKQRDSTKPELSHFVPFDPGPAPYDTQWFKNQMLANIPTSQAAHRFYLAQGTGARSAATIENFETELASPRDALAFVGHSRYFFSQSLGDYSIGICLIDLLNPVLVHCLDKQPVPGDPYGFSDLPPGDEWIPKLNSEAKVVFIAACDLTDIFKRFVDINSNTTGRALVVSTSETTYLGTASQFWTIVATDLTGGCNVTQSFNDATNWFAAHPAQGVPLPTYTVIGDGNVRIAQGTCTAYSGSNP